MEGMEKRMAQAGIAGLHSVIYPATDLAASKAWWTRALGIEPYYDQPFYVGFQVGGFELGLDPDTEDAPRAIAYWRVADMDATRAALLAAGAAPLGEVRDVGGGIRLARLRIPDGNEIGLVERPQS